MRLEQARLRPLLLAVFIALVLGRVPTLTIHPRFWAEEGGLFLNYAYAHSIWQALSAPLSGYYNLAASLGAVLAATLLPIELAPYATLAVSLLAQITPALVVLSARGEGPDEGWWRPAVLLLLLLAFPSQEVWLNTVNSQFHLCAAAGLILVFRPTGPWTAWGWRAILFAGGLSGVAAASLAPLFAYVAWRERDRERAIQAAILALCAVVQVALIAWGLVHNAELGLADPNRGPPSVDLFLVVVAVKSVVAPIVGSRVAEKLGLVLRSSPGVALWWLTVAVALGAMAGAVALVRPVTASVRLLAAYLVVAVVSAFGWLGVKLGVISGYAGARYFYAPNLFLGVGLLLLAFAGPVGWRRLVAGTIAAAMLINGAIEFRTRLAFFHGPDWRTEVRRWRNGESDSIAVHPPTFERVRPPPSVRAAPEPGQPD